MTFRQNAVLRPFKSPCCIRGHLFCAIDPHGVILFALSPKSEALRPKSLEDEWKAGRTNRSDEEFPPSKYYPLTREWSERLGKALWALAHRGFRKDEHGDYVPIRPFPWQLKSECEFYEIQEELEAKYAVRLVSKARDAKGRGKDATLGSRALGLGFRCP